MNPKAYLVSAQGGTITYLSEVGEVYAEYPVPPGRVPARDYLWRGRSGPGDTFELSPGLVIQDPPRGFHRQKYGPAAYHSGANPDYQPTSADRMQREMRVTLNRMQAATKRVEARERALAKLERIPARSNEGAEVIEREAPVAESVSDDKTAIE